EASGRWIAILSVCDRSPILASMIRRRRVQEGGNWLRRASHPRSIRPTSLFFFPLFSRKLAKILKSTRKTSPILCEALPNFLISWFSTWLGLPSTLWRACG
ncbi:unnamed protein product, partial [Aphanomyces euteiches]